MDNKTDNGLTRRTFIGALGAGAVAAGGGLLANSAAEGQKPRIMGMDSFGNIVPASPYSTSVGVYPPPLHGNQPAPADHLASPNILVILVDQLRNPTWFPTATGGQSAFDAIMPNLAKLRNHSYIFSNYYTAATACTPARATLLTGLYSQENGIFTTSDTDTNPPLNPNFKTYGRAAQDAGYSSYWFGKWHLSNSDTDGDAYDSDLSQYGFSATSVPNASVPSPNGAANEGTEGTLSSTAPNMRDGAIFDNFHQWIPNASTTQTWCTTVSFVNPHDITFFPWAYFPSLTGSGCPSTSLPEFCAPTSPPTTYFAAPPTAGSGPIPALPSLYTGIPPNQAINGQLNVAWNGNEDVSTYTYGQNVAAKPSMQAEQQTLLAAQGGSVVSKASNQTNWALGWTQFLNYYLWMQACVDYWIGKVINDLQAAQGGAFWGNTVIIFTADHGDFGGSHAMHAKGDALYDEAINVPLYVSYPGQRGSVSNYNTGPANSTNLSYMCSSVDFLPMIYTIATNSFSWRRSSTDPYYYLAGREAIMDAIWYGSTQHQRTVTINNVGYNYILHTTDETFQGQLPWHAIGMRTINSSDGTPGGKLGVYTKWATCSTQPDSGTPQYEFYDYAGVWTGTPNPSEINNDAIASISPVTLTTGAQAYLTALQSIQDDELYGNAIFAANSNLACYHDQALYTLFGSCVTLPTNCPMPPPVT